MDHTKYVEQNMQTLYQILQKIIKKGQTKETNSNEPEEKKRDIYIFSACFHLSERRCKNRKYESKELQEIKKERENLSPLEKPCDAVYWRDIDIKNIANQKANDIVTEGRIIYNVLKKTGKIPELEKFVEEEIKKYR